MIAGGGECISDIAALADQPGVFGPVASDSTCWRVLDDDGTIVVTHSEKERTAATFTC
jgi:hypothetical protein